MDGGARFELHHGDCREVLRKMPDCSVDSVVGDPPYHLLSIVKRFGATGAAPAKGGSDERCSRLSKGFMGKAWDGGDVAFRPETWAEVWRVLKPGGHLLAFSGTRTYHRMACAIEDADFEIRDQFAWMYGSGFPKSHDFARDDEASKAAGHRIPLTVFVDGRFEEGWGTAVKPAWEPICFARKPLIGTVAENVARYGTGALNIDACRIDLGDGDQKSEDGALNTTARDRRSGFALTAGDNRDGLGRWPANVIHDGSDEVLEAFAAYGERGASAPVRGTEKSAIIKNTYGERGRVAGAFHGDNGTAARFFYCAKASRADRDAGLDDTFEKKPLHWSSGDENPGSFQSAGTDKTARNNHPTVKPTPLMAYLCRLVTPPGGTVLDPFMGSGSTGRGAILEGFRFIGIELDPDYLRIAAARIEHAVRESMERARKREADARQLDMFAAS